MICQYLSLHSLFIASQVCQVPCPLTYLFNLLNPIQVLQPVAISVLVRVASKQDHYPRRWLSCEGCTFVHTFKRSIPSKCSRCGMSLTKQRTTKISQPVTHIIFPLLPSLNIPTQSQMICQELLQKEHRMYSLHFTFLLSYFCTDFPSCQSKYRPLERSELRRKHTQNMVPFPSRLYPVCTHPIAQSNSATIPLGQSCE